MILRKGKKKTEVEEGYAAAAEKDEDGGDDNDMMVDAEIATTAAVYDGDRDSGL